MNGRILLLLLFAGCYTGAQALCTEHCWGYTQPVTGDGMGHFADQCIDKDFGFTFAPDLPTPASFHARRCVTQPEHAAVENVIASVSAGGSPTMSDEAIYLDVVDESLSPPFGLSALLFQECMDYLADETNCEVDPMEPHAGSWDAAVALCQNAAYLPAQQAMTDLTGCDGWKPPEKDAVQHISAQSEEDCDFQAGYTDGLGNAPECNDEGGDGAEDDTTGGEREDFGDLEELVYCEPYMTWEQWCTMDQQLLYNIAAGFHIFYEEGVFLEAVNIPFVSRGVQISGVDANEETEALLAAFGLQDGDVLTHVNSVYLSGATAIADAIYDFESGAGSSWVLTVRRQNGMTWDTLDIYVAFPVSFGP